MSKFLKHRIEIIYECEAVDFLELQGFIPLFKDSDIPFSYLTMSPITPKLFSYFVEFIRKISFKGFSGNIRDNWQIYYYSDLPFGIKNKLLCFAIVQEENGTLYLGGTDTDYLHDTMKLIGIQSHKLIFDIEKLEDSWKK